MPKGRSPRAARPARNVAARSSERADNLEPATPGHRFDLEEPDLRRWYYESVPREATRPGDLAGYVAVSLVYQCPGPTSCQ